MRRDVWSQLMKRAATKGWVITRRKNEHLLWVSPSGVKIFSSSSASDNRAIREHVSLMRRLAGWDE